MFFNCRNGQGHFCRYFDHRSFVDTAQDKYPPALRRKRLDDRFDLPQGFAGMKLSLDTVFGLQQVQVSDCFETDHLVAPGIVDDQIAGDGEEIGAACRHIVPVFRGIGTGHDLGNHVVKFQEGGQNPPKPSSKRGLLW